MPDAGDTLISKSKMVSVLTGLTSLDIMGKGPGSYNRDHCEGRGHRGSGRARVRHLD